jgi:hypothetical protein
MAEMLTGLLTCVLCTQLANMSDDDSVGDAAETPPAKLSLKDFTKFKFLKLR